MYWKLLLGHPKNFSSRLNKPITLCLSTWQSCSILLIILVASSGLTPAGQKGTNKMLPFLFGNIFLLWKTSKIWWAGKALNFLIKKKTHKICVQSEVMGRGKKKNNTGFLYKESSRIIFCSSVDMLSNFKFSYFGFIFLARLVIMMHK